MNGWPLTIRGTGAVALGIVCFIVAREFAIAELVYIGALLMAITATAAATLYLVPLRERIVRSFDPDTAVVGGTATVHLSVAVRSPLPVSQGRWRDELGDGLTGEAAGSFPAVGARIGGEVPVLLDYTVHTRRRGIRWVGPLRVQTTDPFGLAIRRHTIGSQTSLTVAPAVVDLDALTDLPGQDGGSMHVAVDRLGQGSDNLVPRHYVPGDSMRRIHWRATAHRDRLMVRQEEQETTPEATVVLDRGERRWSVDARRAPGEDPGFEAAVTACVSAVARLVREGYQVTVCDIDGSELAPPPEDDTSVLADFAAAFANVTATRGGTPGDLVRHFTGTVTGPLVVVTGALEVSDVEVLAPLAHRSTLPVLLTVTPWAEPRARAAADGWRVAAIGPDIDLAAAWTEALEPEHGRVRH